MPATPHRDQQVPLAGEVDRVDHVGGAGRSDLECRAPVVHGVVDRVGVVAVVGRCEHVAPEAGTELLELVVFDLGLATIQRGNRKRHRYAPLIPPPTGIRRPGSSVPKEFAFRRALTRNSRPTPSMA